MKFIAKKYKLLRIVLDPRVSDSVGGVRVMKGMNGQFQFGKVVEFNDGEFNTKDKNLIKALKDHSSYGVTFFSDEAGEVATPSDEAVAKENEKKELAEKLASQCPTCGKEFKNEAAVNGHMRVHDGEKPQE